MLFAMEVLRMSVASDVKSKLEEDGFATFFGFCDKVQLEEIEENLNRWTNTLWSSSIPSFLRRWF